MDDTRHVRSRMAETVRDNSLPLALMGMGIGWMVVNAMRESGEERGSDYTGSRRGLGYGDPRATGYERGAGYGAYDSSDYTGYGAPGTTSGEHAEYAGEAGYAERGGGRAREIRDRAGTTAREVRDRAAEYGDRMRHRAQEFAGGARRRISEMGSRARHGADSLAHQSARTYEDHPFMMGSVALLIGAALGAALPRTRREDEMMGHQRDEVMHRAREMGEDAVERARHVAERTAEAARDNTAEAYGRVKDAAKHSAEEAVETAKEAAGDAYKQTRDAAREETERQTKKPGDDKPSVH